MFCNNIPKWLHLEILIILDTWNFELELFDKSGALVKNKNAIDAFERIYLGTDFNFQKNKDDEAKKMADKIKKNDGVFIIKGLSKMLREEDRSFTILSESIKIKDKKDGEK